MDSDTKKVLIAGLLGYEAGKSLSELDNSTKAGLLAYVGMEIIDPNDEIFGAKDIRNSVGVTLLLGSLVSMVCWYNEWWTLGTVLFLGVTIPLMVYFQERDID